MDQGDLASVLVAVIAGAIAIVVTLNETRARQKTDEEVEKLKAGLAENAAERGARRAYEYEARKRLYATVEPLLFQLATASEGAR
jgi:uncharacterized membrane-anchored protein YhcB (DUF1043 family)